MTNQFQWLVHPQAGVHARFLGQACTVREAFAGTEVDPAYQIAVRAASQCPDKCSAITTILANYDAAVVGEIQRSPALQAQTVQQIATSSPSRPSYATLYNSMRAVCASAIQGAPAPAAAAPAPTTSKGGGAGAGVVVLGLAALLGIGLALAGRG